jgi:hypothetical protein
MSVNNGSLDNDSDPYEPHSLDPPIILSTSSNGDNVIIVYFGSVGATSYQLFKSMDNSTFSPLPNTKKEIEGSSLTEILSEYANFTCSRPVYFKLVAKRDELQMTSAPSFFEVMMKVRKESPSCRQFTKSGTLSSTEFVQEESKNLESIIIAVIAFVLLVSSISILYVARTRQKSAKNRLDSFPGVSGYRDGPFSKSPMMNMVEISTTIALQEKQSMIIWCSCQ